MAAATAAAAAATLSPIYRKRKKEGWEREGELPFFQSNMQIFLFLKLISESFPGILFSIFPIDGNGDSGGGCCKQEQVKAIYVYLCLIGKLNTYMNMGTTLLTSRWEKKESALPVKERI